LTASGLSVVNLSIDALAFAITGASLYFVSRQKASQYPYLKSLLVMVHVFFELIVLLDAVRNVVSSPEYLQVYSLLAPNLVFWDVLLLTVIAYSVYIRPGGRGLVPRLRSVFLRWPHGFVLSAYIVFIAGAVAYLTYYRPYTIVLLTSIGGGRVSSPQYSGAFLGISVLNLVFFLAYPTLLLVRATSQVRDPGVRRAFTALPLIWVGIGTEILVFNGYLVSIGFDFIAVGYAIAGLLFGVSATIFRRTSLLSTFFEPIRGLPVGGGQVAVGAGAMLDASMPVLLEVDPTTNFETALTGLARAKTSAGGLVYIFTSKGSPVYNSLGGIPGVRFYVMTSKVSYPSPSDKENELLIPQNDMAVLLDLLDKTVSSTGETAISLVFDNLSDFILYLGFESTYKFLKQANEILDRPKASSVYIVTVGAHDERMISLTKSLFRMHAIFDSEGLRITKGPAGEPKA
jgi:hypothetical protein